MAKAKSPIPEGFHTVTPQLILDNAAEAIEWYKQGLGAEELGRAVGPDGKIMHAELRIGNSIIMVNDAMMGAKGARAFGGSPMSLWIYVDDADALFNRAVKAGGQVPPGPMGAMADQGRLKVIGQLRGRRSVGVHLVDCHPQGRVHAAGDEAAAGRVHEEFRQATSPQLDRHTAKGHGRSTLSLPFAVPSLLLPSGL